MLVMRPEMEPFESVFTLTLTDLFLPPVKLQGVIPFTAEFELQHEQNSRKHASFESIQPIPCLILGVSSWRRLVNLYHDAHTQHVLLCHFFVSKCKTVTNIYVSCEFDRLGG